VEVLRQYLLCDHTAAKRGSEPLAAFVRAYQRTNRYIGVGYLRETGHFVLEQTREEGPWLLWCEREDTPEALAELTRGITL
jgi:hypothetical protein